jgi:hypothetical protein
MSAARISDPIRLANPSSLFPSLMAPRAHGRPFVARDQRVPCDAISLLTLENGDDAVEVRPVDMSDSGIYVTIDPQAAPPVRNGDRVNVCFATASGDPSAARHPAKVVRVELLVGPTEERLGVALAFEA